MTKQQAQEEARKILNAYAQRTIEIEKEAKRNGTWLMGLDSNNGLFKEIEKECNEKLKALASMVDKE